MTPQPLHNLLCIGVLALHLLFLQSQSSITPTVKSEEDLFYLLTKPPEKPIAKIDQELTEHSEFVTPRLWQWLQKAFASRCPRRAPVDSVWLSGGQGQAVQYREYCVAQSH